MTRHTTTKTSDSNILLLWQKKRTATFGYTFLSYISSLTKICCNTWMVWVSCGTITLQIKIALDKLVSMKELLKSTIFPLLSQSIASKRVRKLRCWFISHVNKFMLTYVSLSLCCWENKTDSQLKWFHLCDYCTIVKETVLTILLLRSDNRVFSSNN